MGIKYALRKFGKKEEFTNEDVVGFKIPAKTEPWDFPRRSKTRLVYSTQKVISCAVWVLRERWKKKTNRKNGFKLKYETYQYYDLVAYFMSLMTMRVIAEEIVFSFPYRLGTFKVIKFKGTYMDENGKIHLNLHTFRMKYRFVWKFGSIKSLSLYKFHKLDTLVLTLMYRLKENFDMLNPFFYFIGEKRHGAWVGAPDRNYDELQRILEKNYETNCFRPDTYRLDRGPRTRSRKYLKKST